MICEKNYAIVITLRKNAYYNIVVKPCDYGFVFCRIVHVIFIILYHPPYYVKLGLLVIKLYATYKFPNLNCSVNPLFYRDFIYVITHITHKCMC